MFLGDWERFSIDIQQSWAELAPKKYSQSCCPGTAVLPRNKELREAREGGPIVEGGGLRKGGGVCTVYFGFVSRMPFLSYAKCSQASISRRKRLISGVLCCTHVNVSR